MSATTQWLRTRVAVGAAVVLAGAFVPVLATAAPAHAVGVCVGAGNTPLPGYPCPNPNPPGNLYDVNVFAAQPCEGEPDGGFSFGISAGSCTVGVDTWINLSGGPTLDAIEWELELSAANTSTGLSSKGNPE